MRTRIPVSEESFQRFCELLEQGIPRHQAACQIGTTTTRVRWWVKRNPEWKARYDEASLTRRQAAELRRLLGVR